MPPHVFSPRDTRCDLFEVNLRDFHDSYQSNIHPPIVRLTRGCRGVIRIEHLSGGGGSIFLSVRKCSGGQLCEQHFERFCIDSVGYVSYVYKVLVNAYFLHEF